MLELWQLFFVPRVSGMLFLDFKEVLNQLSKIDGRLRLEGLLLLASTGLRKKLTQILGRKWVKLTLD